MTQDWRDGRAGRDLALALAAASLLSVPSAARSAEPELAFSRRAEPVATLGLAALRRAAPPTTVRVHEPYESREVAFEALRFDRVLDAVYTEAWRAEEELLFTCSDGYQPSVPVQRVLSHQAWLAYDRADRDRFSIDKLESGAVREIELGPFYLVWENLEDAQMRLEADYGWPYQLVGVDLIRSRDRFPKLVPPADASAEVLAGFAAFRVHCSKCHKLNGEGRDIGPELNAGVSPVEYRDREWLRSWIEDPRRIAPDARMPPLNPALPDRARKVNEILAYLEAMADARGEAREP